MKRSEVPVANAVGLVGNMVERPRDAMGGNDLPGSQDNRQNHAEDDQTDEQVALAAMECGGQNLRLDV